MQVLDQPASGSANPASSGKGLGRMCTICQEEICEGENFGCLPCEHMFHVGCIDNWARYKNDCPQCRRSFSQINELAPPQEVTSTNVTVFLAQCKVISTIPCMPRMFEDVHDVPLDDILPSHEPASQACNETHEQDDWGVRTGAGCSSVAHCVCMPETQDIYQHGYWANNLAAASVDCSAQNALQYKRSTHCGQECISQAASTVCSPPESIRLPEAGRPNCTPQRLAHVQDATEKCQFAWAGDFLLESMDVGH